MGRLPKALERHRPAAAILGLLLLAGLFPSGPFGIRARLSGLFTPLALLQGSDPDPGTGASDNPDPERVRRLREEVDALAVELRALRAENASLREFRGLNLGERRPAGRPVLASVFGRDRNWPFRSSLLIDRGSRDGLRRGLPVVAGRSLVGFLAEVGPTASLVRLLDDPGGRADDADLRVGVDVLGPKDGAPPVEGAVIGLRRGTLGLRMVPAGSVREGDLVVTSAADPLVPPGLLVGRVAPGVRENRREGLAEAEVIPTAPTAGLRTVAVLVSEAPVTARAGGRR